MCIRDRPGLGRRQPARTGCVCRDEVWCGFVFARIHHVAVSYTHLDVYKRQEEARVLRRAVGWYAENRVLLDGDRTIIFK